MSSIHNDDGLFEYDVSIVQYNQQGVKITSDCNEIQIWNQCVQFPVIINNKLLLYPSYFQPGTSGFITSPPFIIRGNFGEMDRSQYLIKFDARELANGTASVCVVRKTYKHPEEIKKFFEKMAGHG